MALVVYAYHPTIARTWETLVKPVCSLLDSQPVDRGRNNSWHLALLGLVSTNLPLAPVTLESQANTQGIIFLYVVLEGVFMSIRNLPPTPLCLPCT